MRKFAVLLVLVAALAAPPASALISLLGLKNSMVEFLLDQLSTEGEFEITADKVEEPEDGVTAIRGLKIADSQGVWFMAETLDFSWNSGRLLRGEVEFSNLSMAGIEILRAPVASGTAPPPEDPDPDAPLIPEISWPRSPLTVRIDRLALERVHIAEPVLGHELSFNAEGAAQDEGDIQSVNLDLARTDQISGNISFAYARNFADNTLKLLINAAEAPGGLIAALGDLPDDAPTSLMLDADGPPEDWRLGFALSLADLIDTDGKASISYQGPLKVDARFDLRPGPKLSADVAGVLGTGAKLVARATEAGDGKITIDEGQITAPDLGLKASGTYARLTGAIDLTVDLAARSGLARPIEGVDFGELTFAGQITGAPGSLSADGDLNLDTLRTEFVDTDRATLEIRFRQSGPSDNTTMELQSAGLARGLRIDKLTPQIIGDADTMVDLSLTGSALTLRTAGLSSAALSAETTGTADLEALDAALSFDVSAPDITPVAAAYGVEIAGAIGLSGDLDKTGETITLDFDAGLDQLRHALIDAERFAVVGQVTQSPEALDFAIDGSGRVMRIDKITPDLLPEAKLDIDGRLVDQDLALTRASLNSDLLQIGVAGGMNLDTQKGEFIYDVATPDLAPVAALYDAPAGGALVAKGTAALPGTNAAPQVEGNLAVEGLRWDGTGYGKLNLAHDLMVSESPAGDLMLTSTGGPYGDAEIDASFALDQQVLTVSRLAANALGMALDGAVTAHLDGPSAEGALDFRVRDFGPLGQLAGTPLSGSAQGKLDLTAPDGRQDARLTLDATGFETDGVAIDKTTLRAALRDLLGTPSMDVTTELTGISAGDIALDKAALTARGPLSGINIGANISGEFDDKPIALSTIARVNAANPTIRADISRLDAAIDEDRFALNQPLSVRAQGGTVRLRNLDLSLPEGGRLAGEVTRHNGPLSGEITLSAPKLGFLKRLAEVPLTSGSLDAEARFDTRKRQAKATITGREIQFEGVESGGALGLDTDLDWQGRTAALDVTVSGDFGDPARITAEVPIAVSGGLPGLAKSGPVAAMIAWSGQIGDLWALVPAPGHVLTGDVKIDLGVGGDISDPAITGGARVSDGGYQNLDFGTILTALTLDTELSPDGDLSFQLNASDGAKGTLRTDGAVALDASGIQIATRIDQAVLVRREDLVARIDGTIDITGPANALDVKGDILIDEAEVRLVSNNPPSLVTLGDVRIKGAPEPEVEETSSNVTLEIDVNAPGRLFVRGRGLESEWKLGLEIRGDAAKPRITGRIERVRGSLDFIGKQFDLTRGEIDFNGNDEIDPQINVVLERETQDLTGRIVVDGFASDPQLGFSSTPALPEDEVLPRTLFGRSSQALSSTQAIQLGIGIATLIDGGGGPLDQVRGAVGLDSLQVETDEEGNASVALGKEVAEGVWVGTKQALGDGASSVKVEIDVFENIVVDTEVEQGGDTSLGIQWKKDF